MKKFKNYTIKEYCDVLSKKEPVPGGGSASALSAALAVSLLSMVTNYSIGRDHPKTVENKLQKTLKKCEELRKRLLELVDLDAQAYMKIVKARKKSEEAKEQAQLGARSVSLEVCVLCYEAMQLTTFLVEKGNKYLVSDVGVAAEMLFSSYQSAMLLSKC